MTVTPGPNINLVLVDRAAGHPMVATTNEHWSHTHGNDYSDRTHHVPVVCQCGTKGTTSLCPKEKTQAQQLPLCCPTGCIWTMCHDRHGKIPVEEDDESFQPKDPVEPPTQDGTDQDKTLDEVMTELLKTSIINVGPVPNVIPDDQEPTSLDPHDELLRWHYQLGHLSFDRIKQLASKGQLPKRFLSCKKPFCSACQYGKMTKQPWRVKGDDKRVTKTATRPGQIMSVDQLESNTPGLIAQLKGKLTQQRYKYATVFVDQFSGYTLSTYKNTLPATKR